jgi:pimeloyl-ACP methyl ester carboxylesterase
MRTLIFATALLLLAAPDRAWPLPDANTIEFSNCVLTLPGTRMTANARCGSFEVAENPAEPEGRKISLKIGFAPATGKTSEPDPLFIFAGGPGQAASETWVIMQAVLDKIRKSRDIVMIDQRGTGSSNKLACRSDVEQDLNQELDMNLVKSETEKCLAELDGNPIYYTTDIAMDDYNQVRQAMGYEKINLLGVSYGTRSAQVYLRRYPETVRTVTLDSVLPMRLALGQEHAVSLDRSVKTVFEDCANDETCHSLYPHTFDDLKTLFAELREEPRKIEIINPVTGLPQEMLVSADTLGVAIRFLSYASETQAMLPLLVHEALESKDLSRLASQAILTMSGLSEMLAKGMELSVMCSEDYPYMDFSADYSDSLMGNLLLDIVKLQCGIWPHIPAPADFHQAVISDVPVLLMSGERDPVTPPHYAAETAENYANSLNLVARGQAHSVLKNVCLRKITTAFINQGSVDGLDTACVDNIRPAPFFTSLLGPNP